MKLRLMSVQPATKRYAWEIEVFLEQALKLGYNGNYIDVVGAYDDHPHEDWLKLQQKYPFVRFFFYKNTLGDCNYAPAIQSHSLAKHFKSHEYLKDEAIFYHDSDFVFTRFFDFEPYLNDGNWYFSNCDDYLGADYIESKGDHKIDTREDGSPINILDMMAKVVGICACKVRANRGRAGGAQKLMKGVDYRYWEEVEEDSINLYNWLLQNKDDFGTKDRNDIQVWTASMWAELWNAYKRGKNVMVPSEFDFTWATCHVLKWDKHAFFHNAGVTSNKHGMFYKAEYHDKYPYQEDLELDPNRSSSKYWELIKETGKTSVLI
jgi:hypothetical protein